MIPGSFLCGETAALGPFPPVLQKPLYWKHSTSFTFCSSPAFCSIDLEKGSLFKLKKKNLYRYIYRHLIRISSFQNRQYLICYSTKINPFALAKPQIIMYVCMYSMYVCMYVCMPDKYILCSSKQLGVALQGAVLIVLAPWLTMLNCQTGG